MGRAAARRGAIFFLSAPVTFRKKIRIILLPPKIPTGDTGTR